VGKDVAVGGTVTVAVGDDIAISGSGVVGAAVPHPEMIKAMIATRNEIRFIEFSIEWNAPFILLLVPVDRISLAGRNQKTFQISGRFISFCRTNLTA
jgi:hypothetical protein